MIIDGLTISQFIAAVSLLDAFIGNDTGPIHLAACSGVPVVLLLDRRAPTTYLPLTDELCIVTDKTIDEISVDEVYQGVTGILAK